MSSTIIVHPEEKTFNYLAFIAWSPDGTRIACVHQNTMCVIDVTSQRQICEIDTSNAYADKVAWTPSGKFLVTSGLCVYDAASGKLIAKCKHDFSVRSISLSREMTVAIAESSNASVVHIWDTKANTLTKHRFASDKEDVSDVHWSNDGAQLFIVQGRHVLLYNVQSQRLTKVLEYPASSTISFLNNVQFVRLSPDGRLLATATSDGSGKVHIWSAAIGRNVLMQTYHYPGASTAGRPHHQPGYATDLAWSPDSKNLAIATNDGVRVWDLDSKRILRTVLKDSEIEFSHVCWSPDGRSLAYTDYKDGKELIQICADPFGFNLITNIYSSLTKFLR